MVLPTIKDYIASSFWAIFDLGHFAWQNTGNLSSTEIHSNHNSVFPMGFFPSILSDTITSHGVRYTEVMSASQLLISNQAALSSQTMAA